MITIVQGAPFTWQNADFTWASGDAGKSWLTACPARTTLAPAEHLALAPHSLRRPHITARSEAHLSDSADRTILVAPHTALAVRCALSPRTTARRTIAETITAAAHTVKAPARTARSSFAVADTYLAPWQGILSSVTLIAGGLTDEAWANASASPSGYEAFHPFTVGEYTYRDALVRVLFTTGAAGTDPLLYDVRFHADIEDTRESGIADCTADAPTRITLTRHFYLPPRIVLTVLSAETGEVLIPRLTAQYEADGVRSFDCELRRTDGSRAGGTVSWMAEGY